MCLEATTTTTTKILRNLCVRLILEYSCGNCNLLLTVFVFFNYKVELNELIQSKACVQLTIKNVHECKFIPHTKIFPQNHNNQPTEQKVHHRKLMHAHRVGCEFGRCHMTFFGSFFRNSKKKR